MPIVTNGNSNTVAVLLNNDNKTGIFQSAVNYRVNTFPVGIATGNFNGDGNLDLVTANNGPNNDNTGTIVPVLLGNGDGAFQMQQAFIVGSGLSPSQWVISMMMASLILPSPTREADSCQCC